ncbi:MAG: SAM-dependent methyltransferase [Flavobacteriaceae bacterium]|nr:SAM-dependent methyltransferase [Flavobacteriaceae bacterium]|tara:strand:+ start:33406 stop:33993 length:588 start_codon:yes stop_codon:yes gene_type:complete
MELSEAYWEGRYREGSTRWNIGSISTPLQAYFDQLDDRSLKILIPGAGYGHEAEYLHRNGFQHVTVVDLSETALQHFKKRVTDFPKQHILHADFFDLTASYDLIIEQTFFCALPPSMRGAYVEKVYELLVPKGILVGLLFNFPLTEEGPPFGGSISEYQNHFRPYFNLHTLTPAYNSIPQRQGNELFIRFSKKEP